MRWPSLALGKGELGGRPTKVSDAVAGARQALQVGHMPDTPAKRAAGVGEVPNEAFGAVATLVWLKKKGPPLVRPLPLFRAEWRAVHGTQGKEFHELRVAHTVAQLCEGVQTSAEWRDEVALPLEEPVPSRVR